MTSRGGTREAAYHFIEDFVRHTNSPDEGVPAPGRSVAIRPAGDEKAKACGHFAVTLGGALGMTAVPALETVETSLNKAGDLMVDLV